MSTTLSGKGKSNRRIRSFLNSKRGWFVELLFVTIGLFMVGSVIIFSYKFVHEFNTAVQASDSFDANAKQISSNYEARYAKFYDSLYLTILLFLAFIMCMGAYYLDLHPAFLVPSLLILGFILIGAGILANGFYDMMQNPDIADQAESFPIISFIMGHYVDVILFLGSIVMIVLYAKNRNRI